MGLFKYMKFVWKMEDIAGEPYGIVNMDLNKISSKSIYEMFREEN
jgi:hypothetical protein